MIRRTNAFVIKKIDWQESSQLFTLYTQKNGKISALGRGTKKIQSKLNSSLQPFAVVDISIAPGKNFEHITSTGIVKNFGFLKNSYEAIAFGHYAFELLDSLTTLHDPDLEVYNLMLQYCEVLNKSSNNNLKSFEIIRQRFVLKLLDLVGYQPPEEVRNNVKQIDIFLNQHLERPLQSQKLISSILA